VVAKDFGAPAGKSGGIDRMMLRLAVLGLIIVASFVALFSRLWFLQVLASDDYRLAARENRVRRVYSEPTRGRILDRDGKILVDSRQSLAVTVDRQIIDERKEQRRILRRITRLLVDEEKLSRRDAGAQLKETYRDLKRNLRVDTVSPYKPVAVAYDVDPRDVLVIEENPENFRGVGVDKVPVRIYPQGRVAAQILGYLGEISADELKLDYFKQARPRYNPGDIVGKLGVERVYDRFLRGRPRIEKVVVNSANEVIDQDLVSEGRPGRDLVLSLDLEVQRLVEKALADGIGAARGAGYEAPNGAAVVMDPNSGGIVGMASYPTYDPSVLADGMSFAEQDMLQGNTPDDPADDALVNRATQAGIPPGSTFKVVTAGAAIANGVASPTEYIDCNPSYTFHEEEFNNWTFVDMGPMDLSRSLEVSCDTYYYVLGGRLEERFGPPRSAGGDGTERFQRYMRRAGFGHETGIDLAESEGRVPDEEWCDAIHRETVAAGWSEPLCPQGWLPGYTINMSIGQGDLIVSPIQMAVTYSALVNGGKVLEPRVGQHIARTEAESGNEEVLRELKTRVRAQLPLDGVTFSEIREGLEGVVSGAGGTATSAFSGFPLDRFPLAGKTGTAQIGSLDSGNNFAWFMSYAPADLPQYVVAVYIEKAGHGGESAAPVARQIYEGIFEIDESTDVTLGQDASG
jgi:penicillin-binding protein 2